VLGEDQVHLPGTGVVALERIGPVQQHDHVGVLFAARRLTDPDKPLHLHAVIGETALRLAVRHPELRRAQLEHLAAMAELPTVTVQGVKAGEFDGPS